MNNMLLCQASEFGKIIINICIDKDIFINTIKLEKLLIITQGIMLNRYNEALFKQPIIYGNCYGFGIPQVNEELIYGTLGFNEHLTEYFPLLDRQREVIDEVIKKYGEYDSFELEELYYFKKLLRIIEKPKDGEKSVYIPTYQIKSAFKSMF